MAWMNAFPIQTKPFQSRWPEGSQQQVSMAEKFVKLRTLTGILQIQRDHGLSLRQRLIPVRRKELQRIARRRLDLGDAGAKLHQSRCCDWSRRVNAQADNMYAVQRKGIGWSGLGIGGHSTLFCGTRNY